MAATKIAFKRFAFPNANPAQRTTLERYVLTLDPAGNEGLPLDQQQLTVNALSVVVQDGFWHFMFANFAQIGQHSMGQEMFDPANAAERPYYDAATNTVVS